MYMFLPVILVTGISNYNPNPQPTFRLILPIIVA